MYMFGCIYVYIYIYLSMHPFLHCTVYIYFIYIYICSVFVFVWPPLPPLGHEDGCLYACMLVFLLAGRLIWDDFESPFG